ncbi:LacI family transcriptional regulator [Kitasatospora herbaricolor]|uniref:LacI family DNA-binding transcriptional regulator n=1 Tax=Kitasatospora herbaricolor TaxID=68217 RepID=UPI00174A4D63|nr:LacI family DNA-binding transcriptional regulator [Kitasatospora herbaricolor]MDQ0306797.1 LacI family transcriptional regulator [Kitasatospora herbaricolor]GGV44913.1 LacI family transcriptional regulator [Kitasatospora herbaricolor]
MASPRRTTLHDVAQEVGVSAKTVSRVLNGDGPTSEATRAKVMAAVEKLGFQPNLMARNMRVGGPDSTVGLIIPDMGNPFFGTVAGGIESAVRERGLTLLMGSSADDPDRERALITTFLGRRVSALMVVPAAAADHGHLRAARTAGMPVVFLDRPGTGLTADSVVSSNRDGTREGTAHLITGGHRRIAFIGDRPATLYTRRERLAGYREALEAAHLPYDRSLVLDGHTEAEAAEAVLRVLHSPHPPTAILAANNFAAMGTVRGMVRAGRRDIALVSFDDLPFAEVLEPAITTVAQDPAAIGTAAAEIALARLDGDRTRARTVTVPTRLIPRGSGELPPSA